MRKESEDMEFKEAIRKRYSCRKYDPREVEQEKLDAVLEAGRLAPTAKNLQEQRIYVIRGEEGLAKADRITPCRYGAPLVLLVAYDKNDVFVYSDGRDSGAEDASIVATQMILAAADEGLASCWLNKFESEEAKKIFGLPENEEILMLMDLGYAAEGALPGPNHENRKPLEETVRYI